MIGGFKIEKIIGDFSPCYIYGTVKTHKTGNPLRCVVSQILSPVYEISEKLNKIISRHIPDKYTVKLKKLAPPSISPSDSKLGVETW